MLCPKIFQASVVLTRISGATTTRVTATAKEKARNRSEQPEFVCANCGKCFLSRHTLLHHALVHSDHKPFSCPHDNCPLRFRRKGDMKKHVLRIHEKLKPHRCSIRGCRKAFATPAELNGHSASAVHSDAKPEICPEPDCGKTFGTQYRLRAHRARWHNNEKGKKYSCETCGKKCWTRSELRVHMRTHTGEKPCVCPICSAAFASASHLSSHVKRKHTGEKWFECVVCQTRFMTAQDLRKHSKVHLSAEERRPLLFPCDVCSKTFISVHNKKSHMQIYHAGPEAAEERPFVCSECGKAFKTMPKLKGHQLTHLSTQDRPYYTCGECGKSFTTRGGLVTHGALHTGLRTHACSYCPKTFRRAAHMALHIAQEHTLERPHRCTLCRAAFVTSTSLKRHLRTVHKDPDTATTKWPCWECGKEYSTKWVLTLHKKRKHSDDAKTKPHACKEPGCSSRFVDAAGLRNHQVSHSDDKPFGCPLCPSAFGTIGHRTKHVRRIHAREKTLVCSVVGCGKRFLTTEELRNHSLVHVRPENRTRLTCALCDQSFLSRQGRVSHMRNVHLNERPHACGECEFASASASSVRRHKADVHGQR